MKIAAGSGGKHGGAVTPPCDDRAIALLSAGGMTCGACSSAVDRPLRDTAGVLKANVSCVTHSARVEFDQREVTVDQLGESVEDIGFDASLTEAEYAEEAPAVATSTRSSVELNLKGMTCTACSGAIERLLVSLSGVERATVSLVAHKAFVVCDLNLVKAEELQSEIEDIGFDAEIALVSNFAASSESSRAALHVRVRDVSSAAAAGSLVLNNRVMQLPGVVGCQDTSEGIVRVIYDPQSIGARVLLKRLTSELFPEFEVEWVRARMGIEELQNHIRGMDSLRSHFCLALPFSAAVFIVAVLLPGLDMGRGHLLPRLIVHHGVDVVTVALVVMATPVQWIIGHRFHVAALRAVKRKAPNMDVLVSVASSTAYCYSMLLLVFCFIAPVSPGLQALVEATDHFLTMGPILITVVLFGKFLEARAKLRAMKAMTELPSSIPDTAVLCGADGETEIPVEHVELGDVIRIFAGGKIAVDGIICSDTTVHVDEALLTGESLPVSRSRDGVILGGTTCISGGCLQRVTKVGRDTTLGQIYQMVQEAQSSKAEIQRVADIVSGVFVPCVMCISFATFFTWLFLVLGGYVDVPSESHEHGVHAHVSMEALPPYVELALQLLFAMKFGLAVLMIACPCAMGLATPMAVMVATGVAARRGCLVKSAAAFESSARLNTIVLDKTGTLTEGSPEVQSAICIVDAFGPLAEAWATLRRSSSQVAASLERASKITTQTIGSADAAAVQDITNCFWWLLGTLESASDHPLAKSILRTVDTLPGLPPVIAPTEFEYSCGRGVKCIVGALNGVDARVGNLRFYEETVQGGSESPESDELLAWVGSMQESTHSVALLHVDGKLFGAVALRDPIRHDAAWAVDILTNKFGLDVWLCSGDNLGTTQSIARELGIRHVVAEALPSTKQDCVRNIQCGRGKHKGKVCFVGDGVNDSLALAQADVGIAIGVGAHVAVAAADAALLRADLGDCIGFIELARQTYSVILLNFFWAFCFNFVCLPLAAGVFYPNVHIPPLAAGFGMAASSCLVVFTSLSLRRRRFGHWRRSDEEPKASEESMLTAEPTDRQRRGVTVPWRTAPPPNVAGAGCDVVGL
eukprot:TRINITY_DN2574_c0_g1_i2.p1 TRINITY_DN2574_c0_g1~~TRINITY_DN2574_c0_g1_i2.p1  ORF type:complete len:1109 (+),score=192.33 TRINITY_DN2574_c0_g1_i2:59-3328(+)